jgi:hypothetical protein
VKVVRVVKIYSVTKSPTVKVVMIRMVTFGVVSRKSYGGQIAGKLYPTILLLADGSSPLNVMSSSTSFAKAFAFSAIGPLSITQKLNLTGKFVEAQDHVGAMYSEGNNRCWNAGL